MFPGLGVSFTSYNSVAQCQRCGEDSVWLVDISLPIRRTPTRETAYEYVLVPILRAYFQHQDGRCDVQISTNSPSTQTTGTSDSETGRRVQTGALALIPKLRIHTECTTTRNRPPAPTSAVQKVRLGADPCYLMLRPVQRPFSLSTRA